MPARPPFATLTLIVFCILGFTVTLLEFWPILNKLFYQPVLLSSVGYTLETAASGQLQGQVWRVITPSFLHFGWFHFVFNVVCLWLLGTQIESKIGARYLFLLFFLISVISNTAQYAWVGPHLFGGFSGVNYGLLGFCYFVKNSDNESVITIEPLTTIIMAVFFVLGLLPLPDFLDLAEVANTAHIVGFITGMLVALVNSKLNGILLRRKSI